MMESDERLALAIEDLASEVTRLIEMLDGLREDIAATEEAIQKANRIATAGHGSWTRG